MNRRLSVIQAAVSLLSLAAVVWWALRQEPPRLPDSVDALEWLVLSAALYALVTLVRGERWQLILERNGIHSRRAETYRLTTIGYMGNNVLPARAGELLRTFLLAPRAVTSKRAVLGTIVAERLLDALALALVFLVLAYGLLRGVAVPGDGLTVVLVAIGAGVVLAALAAVVLLRRSAIVARARAFAGPLVVATRRLLSGHGILLLGLSIVIWVMEASVYLAVARAVELDLGVLGALYVVAFTNLFALIPAAPGYVGTFDAAVLFAVKALGGASSAALSYLLLLRFILFVPITLVGLGFLVARYGGWQRYRAARLEARRA